MTEQSETNEGVKKGSWEIFKELIKDHIKIAIVAGGGLFIGLCVWLFSGKKPPIIDTQTNAVISIANELGVGFINYRGVIKNPKGEVIESARCVLSYNTLKGEQKTQTNDTTDFTGYYLFRIPTKSKNLTLTVYKDPSDKQVESYTLDEKEVDNPQTIIYK